MMKDPGLFVRYAWLVPALPLLGALIVAAGGRWLRSRSHLPIIAGIGLAFVVSLGPLFNVSDAQTWTVANWLTISNLEVPVQLRVDGLSTMMLSMVTFVSFLVAIFAAGYMDGDGGYPRFFAEIGLFVFCMTGLLLSNNYILTYAFWEGVGLCSYLLVGHWYARPAAAAAAIKAFLVNRVGDFGFALAIFWLWSVVPGHDLSYDNVFRPETLASMEHGALLGISLLLFWGATAKSAQVPLYVWLPDAMEGPTPVSALIHAATMVTAGVYLVARSTPLVAHAPSVQLVVATVGCVTALLAAAIAVTQNDLKRVMAYSTVSQLGYMFMALGAGVGGAAQLAIVAAMFHLFTHAFFKALLFLASGSVMHAMGDVIDMRRFGGLRHRMPITCWTFAVGGLALAAVPPFSGFFSKDEILLALSSASHTAHDLGWGWAYTLIYWAALFTAFLTAFYTGRAFFMTFFGPEKLPSPDDPEAPALVEAHGHAQAHDDASAHDHRAADVPGLPHAHHGEIGHESPPVMAFPLLALAGFTVLFGLISLISAPFVGGPAEWFAGHLDTTLGFEALGHAEHGFSWMTALLGTLVGVGGIYLSYRMYALPSPAPARMADRLRPLYQASQDKFRVDETYQGTVMALLRFLSYFVGFFDTYVVDRLVVGIARVPRWFGREKLAALQNGLVQHYAAGSAVCVSVFLLILLLLGS